MKFYLFIDESGKFDPAENPPAVVGGVCGPLGPEAWKTCLLQCVDQFNTAHRTDFDFEQELHRGPLLDRRAVHRHALAERQAFVEAVTAEVQARSLFRFVAQHPRDRWVFSRQAAYGMNLLAALRVALDHLAVTQPMVSEIEIVIATRAVSEAEISEAADSRRKYIETLLPHVATQLAAGGSPGAQLVRRLGTGLFLRSISASRAADYGGLGAADFACGNLRGGGADPAALRVTPDAEISVLGDWDRFFTESARQLRILGQYGAAAAILRENLPFDPNPPAEWQSLLAALRQEPDAERLFRELPSLVSQARHLMAIRERQNGAFPAAGELLDELCRLGRARLSEAGDGAGPRRAWAEMLLDALAERCAWLNHSGASDGQEALVKEHAEILRTHGDVVVGDYVTDRRRRLELRNRVLNRFFNDYRFLEVIEEIEPEANRLAERVEEENVRRSEEGLPPVERDELLGKLQGSVGQACAFLSAADASWKDHADEWLQRSQGHFPAGSKYFAMAVNYRVTLAWQNGDLATGCAMLATQPGMGAAASPGEFRVRWPELAGQLAARPFDAVNVLRLAALAGEQGMAVPPDQVGAAEQALTAGPADAHPHEQIAKWLGYLWILAGDAGRAHARLSRGLPICDGGEVALQIIGLSLQALDAIAVGGSGDDLEARARKLGGRCAGFAQYLGRLGGPAILPELVREGAAGAARMARLLPFTYS